MANDGSVKQAYVDLCCISKVQYKTNLSISTSNVNKKWFYSMIDTKNVKQTFIMELSNNYPITR